MEGDVGADMDIKKKDSTCFIISGGRFADVDIRRSESEYVIACDKGLDNADRYGIRPDLVIGDFDSVSGENLRKIEESEIKYIRYPKEKDDTDTMLAIKHALDMGFSHIKVTCAFGGRMDHSFANIQAARYAAERGAVVELVDDGCDSTIFANEEIEFNRREGCFLSVFSLSDISRGVSIKGAKYELENAELTGNFPLGVSNEFTDPKTAVSVKDGCLMVVISII